VVAVDNISSQLHGPARLNLCVDNQFAIESVRLKIHHFSNCSSNYQSFVLDCVIFVFGLGM
jgi:hypothetical protein